jgi:hypothetical protein
MENIMKKSVTLLTISLFIIMFIGCGVDDESSKAKRFEVMKNIDNKNYEAALRKLNADCAGYNFEECSMLKGASYLGQAGYDAYEIGRELVEIDGSGVSSKIKEQKINKIIFRTLLNGKMIIGVKEYKKAFTGEHDATNCNGQDYQNLTQREKDICVAINPILLQKITSNDDVKDEKATVDLGTLAQLANVIKAAIPGVGTDGIVSVLSGGKLETGDLNKNKVPDELDATKCIINAINDNAKSVQGECVTENLGFKITSSALPSVVVLNNITYGIFALSLGESTDPKKFYRLVTRPQPLATAPQLPSTTIPQPFTTVTTTDKNISADGVTKTCDYFKDENCYPQPKTKADGTVETFNSSITDVLNDNATLSSIAVLSNKDKTEKDKTEKAKIDDFKANVCEGSNCKDDNTITQEAFLNYLSKEK